MPDLTDMGVDWYFGGPDEPQPNWRDGDPDDAIDDNDDPAPISRKIMTEILGFDPNDEDAKETKAQRIAAFNENHDDRGRFAESDSSGKEDHDSPASGKQQVSRSGKKELRSIRNHAQSRLREIKDRQADEKHDLHQEHEHDRKQLGKEHAREHRDLEKEYRHDARDMAKEHDKERSELAQERQEIVDRRQRYVGELHDLRNDPVKLREAGHTKDEVNESIERWNAHFDKAIKQHDADAAEVRERQKQEPKALAEEYQERRQDQAKEHASAKRSQERDQAKEVSKMDKRHEREIAQFRKQYRDQVNRFRAKHGLPARQSRNGVN